MVTIEQLDFTDIFWILHPKSTGCTLRYYILKSRIHILFKCTNIFYLEPTKY